MEEDVVGAPKEPRFHELMETAALRRAERTFYSVGPTEQDAYRVLDEQLTNLEELARFIVARVAATVLEDEAVLTNGTFIEKIDLENLRFDPTKMREYAACRNLGSARYLWFSDPIGPQLGF